MITYTTDGDPPTETSTRYTSPVALSATTTLKAGAFKTGWTPSDITTGTFIIEKGNQTLLYLRDHNLLSDKKGAPVPWITRHIYPASEPTLSQWETTLEGDITGTFQYRIDVVAVPF